LPGDEIQEMNEERLQRRVKVSDKEREHINEEMRKIRIKFKKLIRKYAREEPSCQQKKTNK
jgi:hypothetical protein